MFKFNQKYIFKDSKKSISKEQEIMQSNNDDIFTFGDGNRILYTVNAKNNELIIENKEEFLSSLKAVAYADGASKGMKSLYDSVLERAKNDDKKLVLPIDNVKMDLKLGLTLDMKDSTGIAKKFKINGVGLQVMPNGENAFTSLDMQTRTNFFMTNTTVPKNIVDLINDESLSFGPSIGIELFDALIKEENNVNKFSTVYKTYGKDNCKIFDENRADYLKIKKINLMKVGNYIYVPSGSSAIAVPITEKNVRIVKINDNNYMFKFVPDNKHNAHGNICLAGLDSNNLKKIMHFVFQGKIVKGQVFKYDFEALDGKEEYLEPNAKSKNTTTIRVDKVEEIFKPTVEIKETSIENVKLQKEEILEDKIEEKGNENMEFNLTAPNNDEKFEVVDTNKNEVVDTNKEFEVKPLEYPLAVTHTNTNNNENLNPNTEDEPVEISNSTDEDGNEDEFNIDIEAQDNETESSSNNVSSEEKESKDEFELDKEKPKEKKNDETIELKDKIKKLEEENKDLKNKVEKLDEKNKASLISNTLLYFGALILLTLAFFTGNVYLLIGSYLLVTADATVPTALIQDSIKGLKNTFSKGKKKEKTQKQKLREEKKLSKKQNKKLSKQQKKQEKLNKKQEKRQNKIIKKEEKKQEKQNKKEAKKNYNRPTRIIETNPTEKTDLEKEVEALKEKLNNNPKFESEKADTTEIVESVQHAEYVDDLSELNSENTVDMDSIYDNKKEDTIVEIIETQKNLKNENNKDLLP